jgi:hypothetical protein
VLVLILVLSAALMAGLVALLEAGRAEPTAERRAQIQQRERPGSPAPFDELHELRQELDAEQQQRKAAGRGHHRDLAEVVVGLAAGGGREQEDGHPDGAESDAAEEQREPQVDVGLRVGIADVPAVPLEEDVLRGSVRAHTVIVLIHHI